MIVKSNLAAPRHGGDLTLAKALYPEPKFAWLDMSTGISPWPYPIPSFSVDEWHYLPKSSDELLRVAQAYYQTDQLIALTPGSQAAIRVLPRLLEPCSVAVPRLGYREHQYSWFSAGHSTHYYDNLSELIQLSREGVVDHAVVINPNNPTAGLIDLLGLEEISNSLNGVLVVDEAFGDLGLDFSATNISSGNVLVLKSLGKFFGLAGARVEFAIGDHSLTNELTQFFNPWSVSGASVALAESALSDFAWQKEHSLKLRKASLNMKALLSNFLPRFGLSEVRDQVLFHTVFGDQNNIDQLHLELARLGIWARKYNQGDKSCWCRLSLPKSHKELEKRLFC